MTDYISNKFPQLNRQQGGVFEVRNIISLEVSGTDLAERVVPPRVVREMDWVEKFWPSAKKGRGHTYPKVQLYCLMGVTNAWTVSAVLLL